MVILKIILYFISLILPGLILLSFFKGQKHNSKIFRLALAYGLGSSFVSIILFAYFFIFRLTDSNYLNFIIWGIILVLALVRTFIWRKNGFKRSEPEINKNRKNLYKWQRYVLVIILFFLISNLIFLVSNVLSRPAGQFDSISMWSFKAKVLYYQGGVDFNPNSNFYLGGGGHPNYPWQIPLQEFWLHKNLGHYDDLTTNWIFLSYFLCLLVVLYGFLKENIGFFRAVVFSFFFFSLPLVFYHGFNAYADLPLTFYILCAVAFFYSWLKNIKKEDFILAAIFWGFSFWVKDTALIFFGAFLIVFLAYIFFHKFTWKQLAGLLLIVLGLTAPWLIFKQVNNLGFSNTGAGLVFRPGVISSLLGSLFVSYSWNIWWFIVLITGCISYKKIKFLSNLAFIWLLLLLSLLVLTGVFVFTLNYGYALDQTAPSRCLMALAGISVLAVGLAFSEPE